MSIENDTEVTRRDALASIALGGAAFLASCTSTASVAAEPSRPAPAAPAAGAAPPAFAGTHSVTPLPFAAGSLDGISEKIITSHHDNNYAGAVKNLNRVEQELAQVTADTPPFVVAALRDRELTFRNSKTLHEAYFGNLGGNGKRSGAIEGALAAAYGSTATWEQHMHATAAGLGGGSGWAILALELDTGELRTFGSGGHAQTLASSLPLLVLDMYEHAYQMDFGAAAARYIDAFFANIKWEEVNRRLELATRLSTLLRAPA
jgi:superoxide dismutase, Fe-Mn family